MWSDMDIVDLRGVTKTYRMGVGRARVREMVPPPADRLLERLFPGWWWRDTFNALEDVTTSIAAGSSVGIVGHNGAGKTTLLKTIASVTAPTAGTVSVRGRIAALIDALVGFHPELTGRENVYLLASMHGVSRKRIDPRVGQILDFAEISDMAGTPVKRYSAGMSARLGFAVITALDPDVLLIYEVLAVGDIAFQRKCIQWLDEYRAKGGTLLFVSHNLGLIRSMTERVVWIDHGRVVDDGATEAILSTYARAMEQRESPQLTRRQRDVRKALRRTADTRWGAGGVRVDDVHIEDRVGASVAIDITFGSDIVDEAVFCVGFIDESGREIGAAASPPVSLSATKGSLRCVIDPLPFQPGIYFPVVAILSEQGLVRDRWRLDRAVVVDGGVGGSLADFGPVSISAAWAQDGEPEAQIGGRYA
jgi:ABC-type polysaccharide/polyol phosphate transport system ATPase subunit